MRPPEFTGGNRRAVQWRQQQVPSTGFNEAAGIHRRKRGEAGGLSPIRQVEVALQ